MGVCGEWAAIDPLRSVRLTASNDWLCIQDRTLDRSASPNGRFHLYDCVLTTHKSHTAFNVMTVGYLGLTRHSPTFRELRLVGLM